ncbi:hypothetical protein BR63_06830 [Thermanaerosceptrum fracticalcis]|uniref:Uncharacterized protein n=1 Tax=Thermanaerosceptrum fracticalcis TaxID=1712410 RepID=A0A7G6E1V2_THEFR|nr:hypothetical protein [Thermanaerosceptrum fracticalcis]QNB45180.1 hypothetical protein BR63_01890 [Thermanaerosceptrum fracticalcis]QNB46056.1 hypothetical protein BR63_06830 [Thermanaerosceptrum fracticalcis]
MQWGTASQKRLYLRREEDKSKNATKVDKGWEEKTTLAGKPKGTAEPGVTNLLGSTSAQPE